MRSRAWLVACIPRYVALQLEYYDELLKAEFTTQFMADAVVAWEYARLQLPYWPTVGVHNVTYVRAARSLCVGAAKKGTHGKERTLREGRLWDGVVAAMYMSRLRTPRYQHMRGSDLAAPVPWVSPAD